MRPSDPIFSYSASPQPVKPRSKYKNVSEEAGLTLMSDPRVVRGNTMSPNSKQGSRGNSIESKTIMKTKYGTKKMDSGNTTKQLNQPTYTFTVQSFANPEINIEQYLIAPESRINNHDVVSQTDEFVPLPPPAEYVPLKTGIDVSTQVDNQTELFDFDREVQPMVDVIVYKTIEQALFEISGEEELQILKGEFHRFNAEKELEAHWILMREQETIEENRIKEKESMERLNQLKKESAVRRKVAASAAMYQSLPAIVDEISNSLYAKGIWKHDMKESISNVYLPSLYRDVERKFTEHEIATELVNELMMNAESKHFEWGEIEHIKRKIVDVHVTISGKQLGGEEDYYLGSFRLNPRSTLSSLEAQVLDAIVCKKLTVFVSPTKALSSAFGTNIAMNFELLRLELPRQIFVTV